MLIVNYIKTAFLVSIVFLFTLTLTSSTSYAKKQPLTVKQEKKLQKKEAATAQKAVTLEETIIYNYNYGPDSRNFAGEHHNFKATTKGWMVLVNVHGDAELNLSSAFDPDKRTLSWATPYQTAVKMKTLGTPHSWLALPREWSSKNPELALTHRKFVSFLIIPPNSKMEFKAGYASPQVGGRLVESEAREGGGLQFRLREVPKGTIVLKEKILQSSQKAVTKELKKVDFQNVFKKALKDFEGSDKLPADIAEIDYDIANPFDYQELAEKYLNVKSATPIEIKN